MDHLVATCSVLVSQLGFRKGQENSFYGLHREFPVNLSIMIGAENTVLLFHIRYPEVSADQFKRMPEFSAELSALATAGRASLDLEAKGAWLELKDAGSLLERGEVIPLLDQAVDALEKLGCSANPNRCHRCLVTSVNFPRMVSGRIEQVCDGCLNREKEKFREQHGLRSGAMPHVLAVSVAGSFISGLVWAASWISYEWVLGKTGTLWVPRLLAVIAIAVVGFLVGKPVGRLVASVPHRGDLFAAAVSCFAVLVGIALGDLLQCVWAIYREVKEVNFQDAGGLLTEFFRSMTLWGWIVHILAAGAACFFAAESARPDKKP